MKKQIHNFWSLNVDEALVASWLKEKLKLNYEVFFPVNSQLPDVDLIVFNSKTKKTITVQVKSSQSYLQKYENEEYWTSGHDHIHFDKIDPKKVDFFVFTCYYPEKTKKKIGNSRDITTHFVIFQTSKLREYVTKFKKTDNPKRIKFGFYIYPTDKKLYENWDLKKQYKDEVKPMLAIQDTLDNSNIVKKMLQ